MRWCDEVFIYFLSVWWWVYDCYLKYLAMIWGKYFGSNQLTNIIFSSFSFHSEGILEQGIWMDLIGWSDHNLLDKFMEKSWIQISMNWIWIFDEKNQRRANRENEEGKKIEKNTKINISDAYNLLLPTAWTLNTHSQRRDYVGKCLYDVRRCRGNFHSSSTKICERRSYRFIHMYTNTHTFVSTNLK